MFYVPWNLLSRLDTSSTASFTACTGSVMICSMSEINNRHMGNYKSLMIEFPKYRYIYIYTFLDICGLPGTALCSTKSNITTPTTTQDRRAARAITSSADIFSFPRNPLRKPVCRAAAPFDPVAAKKERERKRN